METETQSLKRIFLAAHHYPPRRVGGAELYAQRLAQWLTRQGVEVQVICIEEVEHGNQTRISWRDEYDAQVRVRRVNVTLAPNQDLRLWFDSPLLREQCNVLLDAFKPDLVHLVSGYLMGVAPLEAARARNIPTVVTLNDFWFLCPTIQLLRGDGSLCQGPEPLECARCLYDERRIFRMVDQRAPSIMRAFWKTLDAQTWLGARVGLPHVLDKLRRRQSKLVPSLNQADALIVFTKFARDLYTANGIQPEKILVKPYGIHLDEFDPIEAKTEHADEIHFGYLGQVTPIKGVDVLVRAFLEVERANRSGKRLRLSIHGNLNASPAYAKHLQKLVGASRAITLYGAYQHRRALNLLSEMDIAVVPSLWYENSPRVIWESFAARRPVIGTRVGGIADMVQDNVNGLLFERANVNDLARVMQRVLDEPALLPRLTQNIPSPRPYELDVRDVFAVYARVCAARSVGMTA